MSTPDLRDRATLYGAGQKKEAYAGLSAVQILTMRQMARELAKEVRPRFFLEANKYKAS